MESPQCSAIQRIALTGPVPNFHIFFKQITDLSAQQLQEELDLTCADVVQPPKDDGGFPLPYQTR